MEVVVLNRQRSRRVPREALASFLRKLTLAVPGQAADSLAVCLVSDRRMREYNRRFRDRAGSTDVLSFPTQPIPGPTIERHLGDIVISVPAAERQAREARHSLSRELKILALHGYLHLVGYDHETDDGAMLRLQRRLTRRLLPSGARGVAG